MRFDYNSVLRQSLKGDGRADDLNIITPPLTSHFQVSIQGPFQYSMFLSQGVRSVVIVIKIFQGKHVQPPEQRRLWKIFFSKLSRFSL